MTKRCAARGAAIGVNHNAEPAFHERPLPHIRPPEPHEWKSQDDLR
jgi:hypothetical protein